MTEKQANLLDKYLTFKSNSNKNTYYYLNVMNNSEESALKISKIDKNLLNREHHNYCNITTIEYLDFGNGFKDFSTPGRKYYYVIFNNNDSNSVEIRKDLIDAWKRNNAKDSVIVVNTETNSVWDLNMQEFFGRCPLSWEWRWNNEGNITQYFSLPAPTFTDNNETVLNQATVDYITKSWAYLGNVNYAEHRKSKKMVVVAQYDSNGKRKNYHVMKSLTQVYELLHFENVGSLRTFQRMFATNVIVSLFLNNNSGTTYWISTESYLIPPETVSTETENSVVVETIIDTDKDTLETSVNVVANVELDLRNEVEVSSDALCERVVDTLEHRPIRNIYTITESPSIPAFEKLAAFEDSQKGVNLPAFLTELKNKSKLF